MSHATVCSEACHYVHISRQGEQLPHIQLLQHHSLSLIPPASFLLVSLTLFTLVFAPPPFLMYIRNVVLAGLAAASTVQAFNETVEHDGWIVEYPVPVAQKKRTLSGILGVLEGLLPKPSSPPAQGGTCPPIWTQISATLTQQFSANGQCTDAARAAIRAAFHDCFPGACDGSLILANECAQPVNAAMTRICSNLANVASQTKVGVADLIQFAAAHAIKTCPGGPIVPVKVGRKDSSVANDIAILPSGFARGDDLVRLFGNYSFSTAHGHPVKLTQLSCRIQGVLARRPFRSHRRSQHSQATGHRSGARGCSPRHHARCLGRQVLQRDACGNRSFYLTV
ncbi:hypothetical protein ACJBU6_07694 [Exserohilum turcicum]